MIQTQLLKLEPPYRVIYCGGHLANHVGTLIVTEEKPNKSGGYGITTHSHPVVDYGNEWYNYQEFFSRYTNRTSAGLVWDRAELNDCINLPMDEDRVLNVNEFGFYALRALTEGELKEFSFMEFVHEYRRLGCSVLLPPKKKSFKFSLYRYTNRDNGKTFVIGMDGIVIVAPDLKDDNETMLNYYKIQLKAYARLFEREITIHMDTNGYEFADLSKAFGKKKVFSHIPM